MRFFAAIPVLNEWRFIPAVVGQLLTVAERCVIMRPHRSQSGAAVTLSPIPTLDPRVDILEGNWTSEVGTRNAGLRFYSEADYVFMSDSDEILLDDDVKALRALCEAQEPRVVSVRLYTHWKSPRWRIDPPEHGTIKQILRRDVKMVGVREVEDQVTASEVWCRHLSYVRTDEELREKIRLSGHAHEIRPAWYEKVWKAWDGDHSLENLHPVHPQAYRKAVEVPDPELEEVLSRWGCAWTG